MPAGAPTRTATPRMRTSIRHASRSRCASPGLPRCAAPATTHDLQRHAGGRLPQAARPDRSARAGRRISQADVEQIKVNLIQVETRHALLAADRASAEYRFTRITGLAPRPLPFRDSWPLNGTSKPCSMPPADATRSSRRLATGQGPHRGHRRGTGNLMPSIDLELSKRLSAHVDPPRSVTPSIRPSYRCRSRFHWAAPVSARVSEAAQRREAARRQPTPQCSTSTPGSPPVQRTRTAAPDPATRLIRRIKTSHRLVDAYALQFDAGRRSLGPGQRACRPLQRAQRPAQQQRAPIHPRGQPAEPHRRMRSALAGNYRPAAFESVAKPQAPTTPRRPPKHRRPQTGHRRKRCPAQFRWRSLVARWAAAWSAGDFARYRASYVADFGSARQGGTREWERERKGASGYRDAASRSACANSPWSRFPTDGC